MRGAAFFDLDRTLIAGASVFPLAVEAWRQGMIHWRQVASWAGETVSFTLRGESQEMRDEICNAILSAIEGVEVSRIGPLTDVVIPRLVERVRPEALKLLAMHRQADRDTWIASGSPQKVVERLAAALDMTGGIGTNAIIVDGYYTAQLDGRMVHGLGKAEAVRRIITEHGYDRQECYAYSDSISDLPLLELVGHPVAVNPDSELAAIARERAWPIVVFARKTKQAIKATAATVAVFGAATAGFILGRHHGRKHPG